MSARCLPKGPEPPRAFRGTGASPSQLRACRNLRRPDSPEVYACHVTQPGGRLPAPPQCCRPRTGSAGLDCPAQSAPAPGRAETAPPTPGRACAETPATSATGRAYCGRCRLVGPPGRRCVHSDRLQRPDVTSASVCSRGRTWASLLSGGTLCGSFPSKHMIAPRVKSRVRSARRDGGTMEG